MAIRKPARSRWPCLKRSRRRCLQRWSRSPSIGAQHSKGLGLITHLHNSREYFGASPHADHLSARGLVYGKTPLGTIDPAINTGVISSFLHPLDKPIPMVSASDVGRVAAESLQQVWSGRRIVELEGPNRYSPNDIAKAFSTALGRRISTVAVPRDDWESLFKKAREPPIRRPELRCSTASTRIGFPSKRKPPATHITGRIDLQSVIQTLIDQRLIAEPNPAITTGKKRQSSR